MNSWRNVLTFFNLVKVATTACPWCGSNAAPVSTEEHLDEAIFEHQPKDLRHVLRNPLMCPECLHVGSYEDWQIDEVKMASLDSLRAANYRLGKPDFNCASCQLFASQENPTSMTGQPIEENKVGVCGKHNIRVVGKMVCDDFKSEKREPYHSLDPHDKAGEDDGW
ncbi:MAG: hypothetical protein WC346_11255 [Methanogenium sp.]|jgi:hypothetical protein